MLAHLRRGESYRRRGELEAATRDFRAAATLDPAAPLPLELLADVYAARQRLDRAIDTYERRLRLDHRSPQIHYKLALAFYRRGQIDRAKASLVNALSLDPRMPDAHYVLGLCHRDQQRPDEAVEAFERAVTLAPGLIPAREELATLYEAGGRYPNQLEQLQVLAALDSAHVARQIAVGVAHARAGQPDAAAVTFANALERSPDDPRVYQELGRMWLDVGIARDDPDAIKKAIEALDHLGAGPAASGEGLSLYGQALARNGELDAARRVLEQATRRFPVAPDAFAALADVAEQQHEAEAARTALLDYHALVGDDAGTTARAGRLGLLSLAANDVPTAQGWLRHALATEPANPRWLKGLAEADAQAGDLAVAKASVAKALDAAPADTDLLALARRLNRER
jgi:tetratricopeptide (TPR) repeat protein